MHEQTNNQTNNSINNKNIFTKQTCTQNRTLLHALARTHRDTNTDRQTETYTQTHTHSFPPFSPLSPPPPSIGLSFKTGKDTSQVTSYVSEACRGYGTRVRCIRGQKRVWTTPIVQCTSCGPAGAAPNQLNELERLQPSPRSKHH